MTTNIGASGTPTGFGPRDLPTAAASRLRRMNVAMGIAHAVQGVAMLALSNAVSLPVTAVFATGPPGQPLEPPTISELFSYRLGAAVASFSLLSAAFTFSSPRRGASRATSASSPRDATGSGGPSTRCRRR